MRRTALIAALAGLLALYIYAAGLARKPQTDPYYRMYYIDRLLKYWPGSRQLAYVTGDVIQFDGPVPYETRLGWSHPEPWGTWTDGAEAALLLRLDQPPAGDLTLVATLAPYVNAQHPELKVDVFANGLMIAQWACENDALVERSAEIPAALLADQPLLHLTFKIHDAASPAQLGLGSDRRKLGLAFRTLVLRPK